MPYEVYVKLDEEINGDSMLVAVIVFIAKWLVASVVIIIARFIIVSWRKKEEKLKYKTV